MVKKQATLILVGRPACGKSRLERFLRANGFTGPIEEQLPSCEKRSRSKSRVYLDLFSFEENNRGH